MTGDGDRLVMATSIEMETTVTMPVVPAVPRVVPVVRVRVRVPPSPTPTLYTYSDVSVLATAGPAREAV